MKKIILALMMISSFALASSCPATYVDNGITYYLESVGGTTSDNFSSGGGARIDEMASFGGSSTISVFHHNFIWNQGLYGYYYSISTCQYSTTPPPPPQIPTCDYGQGQYLNSSTNTCTDCSSFPTVAGRASCACDSQGSTYNDQGVTGTYTVTQGFTNYDRTDAKCANGGYVPVLLNPRPVDNNSTTPTTPTTPPDTNGSGTGDTGGGTGGTGGGTGTGGTGGTTTPDTNTTTPTTPTTPTGTTNYADLITQLKANNQSVNDFKDKFTQFVTSDQANADRQYNATNAIKSAVDGTTSAVNTQGTAITNKLGDILNAIKDGNGTGDTGDGNNTNQIDLNATNKKLDTLHDDNNKTHSKLDTLHDDANKTNSTLSDIKGLLDFNASKYTIDNMLPEGGEGWFTSKALNLNFNISGDCYCQTAQFKVGGRTFVFPPQELLDMIPFDVISRMLMAFIYVLGLRNFLKS